MTMKRFYRVVEVLDENGGFTVALDGKAVKTPGRAQLILPTNGLADAVAGEWRSQGEQIDPHSMRLTRLANTALDRVAALRDQVIGEIAAYGATDLLCYRAGEPPELVERQSLSWQPLLDWVAERHGVGLEVTTGISPLTQPAASLARAGRAVAAFGDFALAALHSTVALGGSLVIGLALASGEIDGDAAWGCIDLDDAYQAGRWGEDNEAAVRRAGLRAEIMAAAEFIDLCRQPE